MSWSFEGRKGKGMMDGLSGFLMRRRRSVLVIAILLAILGGAATPNLFGKLQAGGFTDPGSASSRAAAVLATTFGQGQPNLTLLVTAAPGVDSPAATAAGIRLTRQIASEHGVTNVTSYWTPERDPQLRSVNGRMALILGTITGNATTAQKRVAQLASAYNGTVDGLRVQVGGYELFEHELLTQGQKDAETGEMIAFPLSLLVLLFIFGSVAAAMLPLLVAFVTVLLCMGFMWILASTTGLSSLAVSVVSLLGLGLAIDYSLLMVNRYRQELRAGRPVADAIRVTMGSAGRTVAFSAATVAVAASLMAWFPLLALRSMAYAGMATALTAAATALTVLPALFAILGPRIEWGRLRRRRPVAQTVGLESGFWHRLAMFVMRRPVPIAVAVTAVLLLLGAPFLGIKLGLPDERVLPTSSAARQVATVIGTQFASNEQDPLQVVAQETVGRQAIASYAMRLSRLPYVDRVDTVTGSYAHGTQVASAGPQSRSFATSHAFYLSVVPGTVDPNGGQNLVAAIRAAPAPVPVLVGGVSAINYDALAALKHWLPYALIFVGTVMVILLFLVTGSALLPFLALFLSALSLTAAFGALVWIFQDGHLIGLFGNVTVTGFTDATVPVMLFGLAFGLAMDYQVFLLSRIREEYELSGSGTIAVARGLERIGGVITAAAVAISIVFLAFISSGISEEKTYGIGLPLAVLMDATLIRGALLPATMKLCGRATWWAPAPLRRLYARFGLREPSVPRPPAHTAVTSR
jgi:RND superfamily putative drug exporter